MGASIVKSETIFGKQVLVMLNLQFTLYNYCVALFQ